MSVEGLDHVQVAAPRTPGTEEQARAFYGGLLGLREIEKPEHPQAQGRSVVLAGSGRVARRP